MECEKLVLKDADNSANADDGKKSSETDIKSENINDSECSEKSLTKIDSDLSGNQNKNANKEFNEDEEDDVPCDFFDDFLKEDFMAGLDIVDEDEGEDKGENNGDNSTPKTIMTENKPNLEKSDDLRDMLKAKGKEKRKDSDDLRNIIKQKVNLKNSKNIKIDKFDNRRDPSKTKRDIERDKAKCEKVKEQKMISEKLKLVETGLVPPGMEMETDLEELSKQKNIATDNNKEPSNSKRSSSPKRKRSPLRRRSRSPHSPIRRKRSPLTRRLRSPRRSREISPRKSNDRPRISRDLSPRRRSREKTRLSKDCYISSSRDRSPRDRSPRRRSLDRSLRRSIEKGLRRSLERGRRSRSRENYRRKRSHSRSKSRSPRRKHESEKKKSFLEELAEKLNETRPIENPYQQMMHPMPSEMYHHHMMLNPAPVPAPVPVPPPMLNQFHSQYDQSFFIGTNHPQISPSIPLNFDGSLGNMPAINYSQVNQPIKNDQQTQKEDFNRLFKDKKITLTEFLSITAKPEVYSTSPAHMKEKINVILRCQEAIKYLENTQNKFNGPFRIVNLPKSRDSSEKNRSPLLKLSQIKLPFTELPKGDQHRIDFNEYLDGLLETLGLSEKEVQLIDEKEEKEVEAESECIPPPPVISSSIPLEIPKKTDKSCKMLSKHIQTEAFKCIDCVRRKSIIYKNIGTQCGNDGMSFSVGTQVSPTDFNVIPKNQSLASLTPAQLLARSGILKSNRNTEKDDFDLLFPNKRPGGYGYESNPYSQGTSFQQPNPNWSFDPPNAGGPRSARDKPLEGNRHNMFNYY